MISTREWLFWDAFHPPCRSGPSCSWCCHRRQKRTRDYFTRTQKKIASPWLMIVTRTENKTRSRWRLEQVHIHLVSRRSRPLPTKKHCEAFVSLGLVDIYLSVYLEKKQWHGRKNSSCPTSGFVLTPTHAVATVQETRTSIYWILCRLAQKNECARKEIRPFHGFWDHVINKIP